MNNAVSVQLDFMTKPLVAKRTLKWLLTSMNSVMSVQMTFHIKPLAACQALKRLLPRMNSDMSLQIRFIKTQIIIQSVI